VLEKGGKMRRIKRGLFFTGTKIESKRWLFGQQKKRNRYNQIIEMAIIALNMQHGCFMKLAAVRKILVLSYEVMKISLGCNADGEYQQ